MNVSGFNAGVGLGPLFTEVQLVDVFAKGINYERHAQDAQGEKQNGNNRSFTSGLSI